MTLSRNQYSNSSLLEISSIGTTTKTDEEVPQPVTISDSNYPIQMIDAISNSLWQLFAMLNNILLFILACSYIIVFITTYGIHAVLFI